MRLDTLVGVEIAVGALGLAEWYMDVEPHSRRGNNLASSVGRRGQSARGIRPDGREGNRTTPVQRVVDRPSRLTFRMLVNPVRDGLFVVDDSASTVNHAVRVLVFRTVRRRNYAIVLVYDLFGRQLDQQQQGHGEENQVIKPA